MQVKTINLISSSQSMRLHEVRKPLPYCTTTLIGKLDLFQDNLQSHRFAAASGYL